MDIARNLYDCALDGCACRERVRANLVVDANGGIGQFELACSVIDVDRDGSGRGEADDRSRG
ncbi:MAG: hypothetical protein ACI4QD_05315, partial [Kiritimatiellia bacterium]